MPEIDFTELKSEWTELVKALLPEIDDDCIDPEDPDETPVMTLTVGYTQADDNQPESWGYQTGDNSYSGAAYFHPHWAVVYLTQDSEPSEVANEIAEQIADLIYS